MLLRNDLEIAGVLPFDAREAQPTAAFLLRLGFNEESVVRALVGRCNVNLQTAQRICAQQKVKPR
jgi:hypothetical protein